MIDQVAEIKDKSDIVEIISSYLTLKKAGANYKAPCPFHSEKSPSFMVSPERQSYKCFGCSEGGDVITFVEKMEGLDFYNALKILAERAGIELKNQSVKYGDQEHKADQKTRLFEINEWAKKVYHKILLDHPKAEKARHYLEGRGLNKETIANFEIGYAPDSWDFILRYLKSKNYTEDEVVKAGVALKSERGKVFDRFRGRIMFPISNIMGNCVAFTSRVLEDKPQEAKYINSAESAIYTKGRTIYGLEKAKLAIKSKGFVVMVEGNMDVIACHQAGFTNTVAVSGTALTLDQLKILSRYAGEIVFCFDADIAGQTAMKRAVRVALQNDITTRIIAIPKPYKDPDECIRADKAKWEEAVAQARPSLEYWIDQLAPTMKLSVSDKKMVAREILPVIKIIYSDIEKEHYLKYLANKLSVSEDALSKALQKAKEDTEFHKKDEPAPEEVKQLSALERLLGLVWAEPALVTLITSELEQMQAENSMYQPLIEMIQAKKIEKEKIKPDIANLYDQLAITALSNTNPEIEDSLQAETKYLLGRLRSDQFEDIKDDFARKIREAEEAGDKEQVKKLLSELSTLIK